MSVVDNKILIREALEARLKAYTPYSHYKVGAALLTSDGQIIRGCNIENAAFSPTVCAERTAFFKAVSDGITSFSKIAIVGGPDTETYSLTDYAFPCGVCRQVMREFCSEKFEVIIAKSEDEFKSYTLAEILPNSFGPDKLLDGGER